MNKNFFYLALLVSCAGAGYYFLNKKGYISSLKNGECCGHSHDASSHHAHDPHHTSSDSSVEIERSALGTSTHLDEITSVEQLDNIIASSDPVVIKVFAEWCPPCKAASLVFPEIVAELSHIRFYELNVSQAAVVKELHNKGIVEKPVNSIPSFICIKNGKAVTTLQGFKDKEDLITRIKAAL